MGGSSGRGSGDTTVTSSSSAEKSDDAPVKAPGDIGAEKPGPDAIVKAEEGRKFWGKGKGKKDVADKEKKPAEPSAPYLSLYRSVAPRVSMVLTAPWDCRKQ